MEKNEIHISENPEEYKRELSKRLYKAFKMSDYSYESLGRLIGIKAENIRRWVNKDLSVLPKLTDTWRVTRALDMDLTYFMTGQDPRENTRQLFKKNQKLLELEKELETQERFLKTKEMIIDMQLDFIEVLKGQIEQFKTVGYHKPKKESNH